MQLLEVPRRIYPAEQLYTSPAMWVPETAHLLRTVFTTPSWPDESAGQVLLRFVLTRDGGKTWRCEWHDLFQHMRVAKSPDSLRAMVEWHDHILGDDGAVRKVPQALGPGVGMKLQWLALDGPVETALRVEAE